MIRFGQVVGCVPIEAGPCGWGVSVGAANSRRSSPIPSLVPSTAHDRTVLGASLSRRSRDRYRSPAGSAGRRFPSSEAINGHAGHQWPSPNQTHDIFEGTQQIQQLVISRAISGLRIE
jgi:hypothetical protein